MTGPALSISNPSAQVPGGLSAKQAMRVAWLSWVVMLAVPVVWCVLLAWALEPKPPTIGGYGLGLVAVGWLVVTVPLAWMMRSHVFRASWVGRPVEPNSYLRGLLTMWGVLEVGALIGMAGCAIAGNLFPAILPVALAWSLMLAIRPDRGAVKDIPEAWHDAAGDDVGHRVFAEGETNGTDKTVTIPDASRDGEAAGSSA